MQKVLQPKPKVNQWFNINTYHSLHNVLSQIERQESEIHIFGTGGMKKAVQQQYDLQTSSINNIYEKLFSLYSSARLQIYLQSVLRQELQERNYIHREYFLERLDQLVQTFYLFAEFNVTQLPNIFTDSKDQETIQLMNRLMSEEIFHQYLSKKDEWTKETISYLICGHSNLDTLYIYEIEYLNFLRMNLFHWLKQKGFMIEFRIPFDEKYPSVFRYWREIYQVASNANLMETHSLDNDSSLINGQRFALFNNGDGITYAKDGADVTTGEFMTPGDFADYYHKHQDTEDVFAINPTEVRGLVQNVTSAIFENKIGRFVYYIQFCKKENNLLSLTFDTLVELITSGLLKTQNISGDKALSFLIDLRDYMYGVENTYDVKSRLKKLQNLESVSRTFDRENTQEYEKNHMKRYMLNPFRAFNFTQPERYNITINQVIELVEKLETICDQLVLEETERINVNDYFKRWQNIVETLTDDTSSVWHNVFKERFPEEWYFENEELISMVYLIANTKLNEIKNINDVTRLQEYIAANSSKPLHLTNITQFNFPQTYHSTISIFFDHNKLKQLVNAVNHSNRSVLLHSLWVDYTVEKQFEDLSIFYLYNILAHYDGPVKFSWIRHLDNDNIKSIYLDILENLYSVDSTIQYKSDPNSAISLDNREMVDTEVSHFNVDKIKGRIPGLYWLDHDFCSKKFFLNAFIEKQPVYESEFHHQLVFGKIGKLFSYSIANKEEYKDLIFPLFPHWTFTKKENLINLEYKTDISKYNDFENITYPASMKRIHILRSVYRQDKRRKASGQYRKQTSFNDKELLKQFQKNVNKFTVKAEPGNHCKMCPFLNVCNEGMYAIDNTNN